MNELVILVHRFDAENKFYLKLHCNLQWQYIWIQLFCINKLQIVFQIFRTRFIYLFIVIFFVLLLNRMSSVQLGEIEFAEAQKTCDFDWILNDYWHFILRCQCGEKFPHNSNKNAVKWNEQHINLSQNARHEWKYSVSTVLLRMQARDQFLKQQLKCGLHIE